jgi:small redox-active disulfide protein 2
MTMNIKILGPGCPRCRQTEKNVREVLTEKGIEALIEKVTGTLEIARYGVFGTPAVIVDDEVKCVGKIPEKEEIGAWLQK